MPAPSSLEASTEIHISITVKWKASDDCDGYQIYRSVSPDRNYELVKLYLMKVEVLGGTMMMTNLSKHIRKNLELGKYIITRSVHTLHILMKHFMGIFLIIFLVRLRSMVQK